MTPITEDQVSSLMKGLQAREKNALRRLSRMAREMDDAEAKRLSLEAQRKMKKAAGSGGQVVPLNPTDPAGRAPSQEQRPESPKRTA